MADRKPLKILPDGGGDSTGLGEFVEADTIGVVDGGTGVGTLAANGILLGNGTSAIAASAAMTTNGTLLIGGTGGPEVATLTAGSNITLTNGDGAITIAAAGGLDAANGVDNRIATFSDADSLNGEANLTFDGNDLFIANGGGMVIGHTSQLSPVGYPPELQVLGTGDADTQLALVRYSANGSGTQMSMTLSRATSVGGSNVIVQDDDQLGIISWQGDDGTTTDSRAAAIEGYVDGTPGENDMPGRLVFSTAADGASSPTERMRIDSDGDVMIGTSASQTARLNIFHSAQPDQLIYAQATHASYNGYGYVGRVTRAANTAYYYGMWSSEGGNDHQFIFRGDGQGQADLVWEDNAMDYAEYFESSDGSALEVGRSVVMDGDKVRVYDASSDSADSIVGVVRPKGDARGPSKHGSAWNHWHKKHLTDDYGTFLREDVTVWEWDEVKYADGDELPEGKEVGDVKIEAGSCYERDELAKDSEWTPPAGATSSTQSVRKRNPDYDESLADDYKSREFRDEWAIIGLLGQVPVKANEATNPRWIKMRLISDAVDLWLVR